VKRKWTAREFRDQQARFLKARARARAREREEGRGRDGAEELLYIILIPCWNDACGVAIKVHWYVPQNTNQAIIPRYYVV
jgi:hypothetical protein